MYFDPPKCHRGESIDYPLETSVARMDRSAHRVPTVFSDLGFGVAAKSPIGVIELPLERPTELRK
jgi:hypothetical protein